MILFILTDGEIHDKAEVIDLLIQCNTLPLSLIIVGIGEGEFTIMQELDDDNCQMVDSKGNATQRDLVQFVKFADFSNNGTALAKEVLEELPRQVSEYYQLMNMSPDDIAKCYKRKPFLTQRTILCGSRKPPAKAPSWKKSPSIPTIASDASFYAFHSNIPIIFEIHGDSAQHWPAPAQLHALPSRRRRGVNQKRSSFQVRTQ